MKSLIMMLCVMVAACVDAPAEDVATQEIGVPLEEYTRGRFTETWPSFAPSTINCHPMPGGGVQCSSNGCSMTCYPNGSCIEICS